MQPALKSAAVQRREEVATLHRFRAPTGLVDRAMRASVGPLLIMPRSATLKRTQVSPGGSASVRAREDASTGHRTERHSERRFAAGRFARKTARPRHHDKPNRVRCSSLADHLNLCEAGERLPRDAV